MAWQPATPAFDGVAHTCTLRCVRPELDGAASAVALRPPVAARLMAAARTTRRFTEPPGAGRFAGSRPRTVRGSITHTAGCCHLEQDKSGVERACDSRGTP